MNAGCDWPATTRIPTDLNRSRCPMDVPEQISEHLVVDSCRRLTGPSLVWREPGAILDLLVSDMDLDRVIECWYRHLNAVLEAIDWPEPKTTHRCFENGCNLLLAAPIDQLYSAVQALETAWYLCASELLQRDPDSPESLLAALRQQMADEQHPALIELEAAAANHQVDFLVDDEMVSLGQGQGSQSFDIDRLPAIADIDWSGIHDIPVAMITGTNGKSTSVRLLDSMARATGRVSGVTSTDFVRVGDDLLDRGDYSGPGGARLLLRDPRLEIGFLEVARGGILRRGLPLRRARVALVTNIAGDHLGQYGVNTIEAMTQTKFAVRRTLAEDGILVTNADDAAITGYLTGESSHNLCWFSLDRSNELIVDQINHQTACCFADQGRLIYFDGNQEIDICAINEVPMTLQGAAVHNVSNALGAIAVAKAMGFEHEAIRAGLRNFNSDASDNPGRMNHFTLSSGATVVLDFAHNEHGVSAIVTTLSRMPAEKRWVLFGSAGDRSEEHLRAIASAVCAISPSGVVITEVEQYRRGREAGEVSQILKQACLASGMHEEDILLANDPLSGVHTVVEKLGPKDTGLLLVLDQRDEIIDYLKSV